MQKLVFSSKEYVIGIEYAALHYQSPKDNRYAYMLEGFDRDWNYVGNQQMATYTNLPHGNYTFKVKAANPQGLWNNEPTTIKLVIKPFWYNTLFFKILAVLIILLIGFSIHLVRIALLKRQKNMLEKMVLKRTEELSEANTLLEEKKEEISLQNDVLLRSRNDLEKRVAERTHELTIAKDKAEESDKLKSAFLANMSHEIRTPLNAIVGFSSLLYDEEMDLNQKRSCINIINNNSDTLLTIINDILDISIIEANQLILYKERFCVDEVLAELKDYYDLKNAKGLLIECTNTRNQSKIFIYNDPIRFRQIFMNLLNNAFKFTDSGSIMFGYKIEGKIIRFFVEDTGIGISESNKIKIFDHFHKIEPYTNKFHQGTGIGLSLCKRLVNLMGGDIYVESVVNKGSVFYFTLPYTVVPEGDNEVPSIHKVKVHLDNVTIIVAEDIPDNYFLIERLLDRTGASITWAHNGKEAVDLVKEKHDQNLIVLMDIKMPVMNGFEACKLIKQMNAKIPVIAITAYATAGDKDNILKNNFDDFISKPLNFDKLWISLQRQYFADR